MFEYRFLQSASLLRSFIFLALFLVICAVPVQAQEGAPMSGGPQARGDWSFRLSPYLFVPMMTGDVGIRGIQTEIDSSMNDLIDNLNGGALLSFEARYRRWSSTTDFIWLGLEDSRPTPREVLFSSAKAEINQIAWTQVVGYQISEGSPVPVELMAGFRFVSIGTDLTLREGLLPEKKFSKDESWIDPVIGARTLINLNDPIFLRIYADIGGFDAASSLTWQALGTLGWRITESTSLSAGYRAIGYDYSSSDFSYDVISHGPIIGLTFNF